MDQARLIGTAIYQKKFESNQQMDREKLQEMMHQLGAVIDDFGMLQLKGPYKLDPQLPPHSSFYARIRLSVQRAFKGPNGLNEDELGLKLHLFRSYIDRQNIQFIRSNFQGKTDLEKLEAYRKDVGLTFDYSTAANYHNRTTGPFMYPSNMKILVPKKNTLKGELNNARMGEFIVSLTTGMFVSQWNVYKELPDGTFDTDPAHYEFADCGDVANTESYNYGASHGQNRDISPLDRTHERLDENHPPDLLFRRRVTRIWTSEDSWSSGGRYADIVKKGLQDVQAWQAIPKENRTEEYEEFLVYCKRNRRNKGFSAFQKDKLKNNKKMFLFLFGWTALFILLLFFWFC